MNHTQNGQTANPMASMTRGFSWGDFLVGLVVGAILM
jgi:hypothetical protein